MGIAHAQNEEHETLSRGFDMDTSGQEKSREALRNVENDGRWRKIGDWKIMERMRRMACDRVTWKRLLAPYPPQRSHKKI